MNTRCRDLLVETSPPGLPRNRFTASWSKSDRDMLRLTASWRRARICARGSLTDRTPLASAETLTSDRLRTHPESSRSRSADAASRASASPVSFRRAIAQAPSVCLASPDWAPNASFAVHLDDNYRPIATHGRWANHKVRSAPVVSRFVDRNHGFSREDVEHEVSVDLVRCEMPEIPIVELEFPDFARHEDLTAFPSPA